jgi:hypothetical protein
MWMENWLLQVEKMLMLSVEEGPVDQLGSASHYNILWKGMHFCSFTEWVLGSCGAASLQGFGSYPITPITPEVASELFNLVCDLDIHKAWHSHEIIFLLSTMQKTAGEFTGLVNHPNVRVVDHFTNKAHGPNDLFLYRYSKTGDFPMHPKKET